MDLEVIPCNDSQRIEVENNGRNERKKGRNKQKEKGGKEGLLRPLKH